MASIITRIDPIRVLFSEAHSLPALRSPVRFSQGEAAGLMYNSTYFDNPFSTRYPNERLAMIRVARESISPPAILLSDKARKAFEEADDFYRDDFSKRIQRSYQFRNEIFFDSEVKEALRLLFHDKCAYCEIPLYGRGTYDHFRPKAGALGLDGALDPDHYWWLAYRWENLYLACEKCNFKKGNKFPVEGRRAPLKTFPPEIYSLEQPLLLDPCQDNPETLFFYADDGLVIGKEERSKLTIETLDLNRKELVEGRRKELGQLNSLLKLFLAEPNRADEIWKLIRSSLELAAPFLAAKRFLFSQWASSMERELTRLKLKPLTDELLDTFEVKAPPPPVKQKSVVAEYHKEQRQRETSLEQVTIGVTNYIERIELRNFRVIEELALDFPDPRQDYIPWIVLLGENGVGKSSVLKAVALAFMDESKIEHLNLDASKLVRYGSASGHVRVYVSGYIRPFEVFFRKGDPHFYKTNPDGRVKRRDEPNKLQTLVFGYGGTRLLPLSEYTRPAIGGLTRVDNLFDPFMPLVDARDWLLSLTGEEGKLRFGHSARAIKKLLMRQEEDTLIRRRGQVKLKVPAFGTIVPLEELSDGYQSTVALATDIMSVALETWKTAEFAEGIVLLDEIDVHLHPTWKMEIVNGLRAVFPRMQFLITTHDPLCLLGTRSGEVHVLNRDLETRTIRATQVDLPPGITPDQVLTGFWFGLPSTYDEDTRQLLAEHRQLLRQGVPESDARRLELEGELRRRLGTFADTSVDRMAQSVATQLIVEEHQPISMEERQEMRDTLLAMVRQKREAGEG